MAVGALRLGLPATADNIVDAFNNLKLTDFESEVLIKPIQPTHRKLPKGGANTNPNNTHIKYSIDKITNRISNIHLAGKEPTKSTKRPATSSAHPYKRPTQKSTREILDCRGSLLHRTSAPDVPKERAHRGPNNAPRPSNTRPEHYISPEPYKSTARSAQVIDNMVALLNRPPSPDAVSPMKAGSREYLPVETGKAGFWLLPTGTAPSAEQPKPAFEINSPKTQLNFDINFPSAFDMNEFLSNTAASVLIAGGPIKTGRDVGKATTSGTKELAHRDTPYSKEKAVRVKRGKTKPSNTSDAPEFTPILLPSLAVKSMKSRKPCKTARKELREDSGYEAETEEDFPTYMPVDA